MKFPTAGLDLTATREAMALYIAKYKAMLDDEDLPAERITLTHYIARGEEMKQRFDEQRDDAPPEWIDLTPGQMAILERAFRMQGNYYGCLIRPAMPTETKAELRAKVGAAFGRVDNLRRARGLPC